MGTHFTGVQKQQDKSVAQDSVQQTIENDPEVRESMKDPMVQRFIAFLQSGQKVNFHQVMQSDPVLAQKL